MRLIRQFILTLATLCAMTQTAFCQDLPNKEREELSRENVKSMRFSAAEMKLVYEALGVREDDPNFLDVSGGYTDWDGRRASDVVYLVPIPEHRLGKICVVEPRLHNVRFKDGRAIVDSYNVRHQRHVWLSTSAGDCTASTEEEVYRKGVTVPNEIDLERLVTILGQRQSILSGACRYIETQDQGDCDKLVLVQLFLKTKDDQADDVCASVSDSDDDGFLLACFSSRDEEIAVSDVVRWDPRSRFPF